MHRNWQTQRTLKRTVTLAAATADDARSLGRCAGDAPEVEPEPPESAAAEAHRRPPPPKRGEATQAVTASEVRAGVVGQAASGAWRTLADASAPCCGQCPRARLALLDGPCSTASAGCLGARLCHVMQLPTLSQRRLLPLHQEEVSRNVARVR